MTEVSGKMNQSRARKEAVARLLTDAAPNENVQFFLELSNPSLMLLAVVYRIRPCNLREANAPVLLFCVNEVG